MLTYAFRVDDAAGRSIEHSPHAALIEDLTAMVARLAAARVPDGEEGRIGRRLARARTELEQVQQTLQHEQLVTELVRCTGPLWAPDSDADPQASTRIHRPVLSPAGSQPGAAPDLLCPRVLGMPLAAWEDLVDQVTEDHGLSVAPELAGGARRAKLTVADKVLALLLHRKFSTPLTVIGRLFSVSRTTVWRGILEVENAVGRTWLVIQPADVQLRSVAAVRGFAAGGS